MTKTKVDGLLERALLYPNISDKPNIYFITHELVTNEKIFPYNIPFADDIVKKYYKFDYTYDTTTQSLVFNRNADDTNYSVVFPVKQAIKYQMGIEYFKRIVKELDQTNLTTEITSENRFLKQTDWTDRVSLKRFTSYHMFEYEHELHLIITDKQMYKFLPIWVSAK